MLDNLTLTDGLQIERKGNGRVLDRLVTKSVSAIRPVAMIMSEEERQLRPQVRPVRDVYVHDRCKSRTRLGRGIAETFAINPTFYSTSYCLQCACAFPVNEFRWSADNIEVGT